MNCFPCFKSKTESQEVQVPVAQAKEIPPSTQPAENPKPIPSNEVNNKKDNAPAVDTENISAKNFTFRELATATKNFKRECLLGEGGFGRVFKGTFQSSGQVVTVKQLDKNSTQGNKEFLVEVMMLSLLHHPNLVELIGYCADGDQRLLVYEYLPRGSVEDNLLDLKPDMKPLDWATRMKIASGTALGLEYLHEKANPPVIYRDLKSSNIMLDEEFNAKLYDYGLAKLGAGTTHVTPRVMGNYGYSAPEYERLGEATMKSDVYSFGVILLELITGRRALDTSRPADEQNLVSWVQPFFKDPKTFPEMADPLLRKEFPVTSLNQAVGVAAMCLQDEPSVRPLIGDVVAALGFLAVAPPDQTVPKTLQAPTDGHSSVEVAPPDHPVPDNFHPLTDDHDSVAVAPPHCNTLQAPNDQSDPNTLQPPTDHKNVAVAPPAVQALSDHSRGDSSSSKVEKSNSKTHEHKDCNQEDRSGSDNESSASSVSSDDEDAYKKENEELDYEVASMSSDSISSSDDESQYGSINKRSNSKSESQRGNNSLKLKRKSTRKTNEGSVRSSSRRRNGEESSHGTLGSGLGDGSQHGSARSSSRRISSRSSSRHISSISSRRNGEESSHGTLGSGLGDGSQRGSVNSSSRRRNGKESSHGSLGSGLGDGSQRGSIHSSSRRRNGEESSHGTLGSGLGDGSQRGSVRLNSRGSSN